MGPHMARGWQADWAGSDPRCHDGECNERGRVREYCGERLQGTFLPCFAPVSVCYFIPEKLTTGHPQVPISPWSKDKKMNDVGLYFYAVMNQDLDGVLQFMFGKVMGWTTEEIGIYIRHLKKEMKDMSIHGYFVFRKVYGQKPVDA